MSGKQMEGDNRERRNKAREARDKGNAPSEEGATQGASKQREKVGDVDHREKIETIRKGKQDVIQQNTPEPKPGYAEGSED
jgi:hypothetical protein